MGGVTVGRVGDESRARHDGARVHAVVQVGGALGGKHTEPALELA